jgi:hypothetical protein
MPMISRTAPLEKADAEANKRSTPQIRAHLRKHPECSYEELRKALPNVDLSKPWFYVLRSQVRGKNSSVISKEPDSLQNKLNRYLKMEILDTIDCSKFPDELKAHYKTHIFPLIKRLRPDGLSIHFSFLSDPPCIEIRKMVE